VRVLVLDLQAVVVEVEALVEAELLQEGKPPMAAAVAKPWP
jgi:hypothetical protein